MSQIKNLKQNQVATWLTSGIILLFLVLQAGMTFRVFCPPKPLGFLSFLRVGCAPKLWPFVDYPMYSIPRHQGDKINQYFVFGILEDNREVLIQPHDLDLNFWIFEDQVIDAIRKKNQEQIRRSAILYQSIKHQKLLGFRLEDRPLMIGREGAKAGTVKTLRTIRLDQLEEQTNESSK